MSSNAVNHFSTVQTQLEFNQIKISLSSPEKILSWSYGEIKKPETINYRTLKPEKDGLFCAKIFGPIKDYECLCGKYKRIKYRGIICEKCGVEVTLSKVRRERMAHIELASPVAHIWFLKSLPSRIATLLEIPLKDLEKVLYFESHIIIEPGLTSLAPNQLLSDDELELAYDEFGEDSFTVGIGAEAVKQILSNIVLEDEKASILDQLASAKGDLKIKKLVKKLKIVDSFLESGNRPEWMILTILPVIPPELRPLVPLDGGRFATSDLNDLYRRVINRNNRLKRLMELRAPDIIVRNEKRMLQEAVDALFDNGRRGRAITGTNKRPLKSLSDMLKGKQGRFRQNLLGKRVDYSGRSVIVVGPELKLHQCGLPKRMALELFKPFIYSRLEARGISQTVKQAKKIVEKEKPEVWDILEEVIREHPVLLNRAPTLHRLGIQAFEPVLVEGKAIRLHPLVCTAFNADFDGDQMAVHVPLSIEAQLEARCLMMSTNNILSPANGKPIIVPSQDIVLGAYYLTFEREGAIGENRYFKNTNEVQLALNAKVIELHTKIKCRFFVNDENGVKVLKLVETTAGRLLIAELLPENSQIDLQVVNKLLTKKDLSAVIDKVYRHCGQKDTVIFCDKLMKLCFLYAFKAGISFGKNDMLVPNAKHELVDETKKSVQEFEQQYQDGFITRGEKYNKIIDAWSKCTDKVAEEMMKVISSKAYDTDTGREKDINSIYMMAHSGARGSAAQMKQLAGMRGLMAKPSGEIIETPIISNFKEGLSVIEYFNSTHGARKGLADTALKTANSGYLTRRLVDVAQDCIVQEYDCGTTEGITISAIVDGGNVIETLSERILGRCAAENIINPETGETIVSNGEEINEAKALLIEKADIQSVCIRSVLTCEVKVGVCAKCYGRDLSRGITVNLGEAVGVVAAQSIGEPGTQLTMRTFHIGGAAQVAQQSYIEASHDGTIEIRNKNIVADSSGSEIAMGRNVIVVVRDVQGKERATHKIPYGAKIFSKDMQSISRGDKICQWDPYTLPVITEKKGYVQFIDLIEGSTFKEVSDESTGITSRVVIDWNIGNRTSYKPSIAIVDELGNPIRHENGNPLVYQLSVDAILSVTDKQEVQPGDTLARVAREGAKTKDITGGLPRVAELFEARKPKDHAVICEKNGIIKFDKDYKNKRKIILVPEDGSEEIEYMLPKGRHISFQDGDYITKGEFIIEGNPDPHDILSILGLEELAKYLINEIQDVYRLQGVKINDKHIEVIVRQMIQKVQITHVGDSSFVEQQQVDKVTFLEVNETLEKQGKDIAVGMPVLLGITKASLQTRSFISAASFQETTKILTEAAISGKVDNLEGLKENVIVGRLIPAGTGSVTANIKKIASKRDQQYQIEQQETNKKVA
jgi:DNA-directed RNA polymerase subunit beta'